MTIQDALAHEERTGGWPTTKQALRDAADRIDELKEANLEFHRVHQAWLYNEKPALEARIATLEAAIGDARVALLNGERAKASTILNRALMEPSDG